MIKTQSAASTKVGQRISTIPSIGSGRATRTAGVVTEVGSFEIAGRRFVDLRIDQHCIKVTLTVSADSLVELI